MDKTLQDKISVILFKHDPMSIDVWDDKGVHNSDEYDPEAKMILKEYHIAKNSDELELVIIQIFIAMFKDWMVEKSKADWKEIAEEIWKVLHEVKD